MTPTPYYDQEGITLYNGDVRDIAPAIDLPARMILADPPYGETSLAWDRWPAGWLSALSKIPATAPLWCFGSMRMFIWQSGDFAMGGWKFAQDIVWEKHNGSGFHDDRFRRVHELAVQFYRASTPWSEVYKAPQFTMDAQKKVVRRKNRPTHFGRVRGDSTYESADGGPRLMRSVIKIRSEHGRAIHRTQKPIGILQPLIDYSSKPGDLIFVPFAGGGSELLAAKEMGRRAIGVEIDPAYCEAIVERLRQGVLFGKES